MVKHHSDEVGSLVRFQVGVQGETMYLLTYADDFDESTMEYYLSDVAFEELFTNQIDRFGIGDRVRVYEVKDKRRFKPIENIKNPAPDFRDPDGDLFFAGYDGDSFFAYRAKTMVNALKQYCIDEDLFSSDPTVTMLSAEFLGVYKIKVIGVMDL